MQHLKFDLGQLSAGTVVRVTLEGTEANVRLMDSHDYRAYSRGQRHHYVGGHYNRSPITLQVPSVGHYFVAVDYGGGAGRGRASVQVLTNA